jgi:hypothetical protein|tara:strand:- start:651 stop:842 length:192 start_codon:yes stop_codon:yes gene_type:complete
MTNIYDVLGKLQVKATGSVEKSVKEEIEVEDPPVEEAVAFLEEATAPQEEEELDESTEGDDGE